MAGRKILVIVQIAITGAKCVLLNFPSEFFFCQQQFLVRRPESSRFSCVIYYAIRKQNYGNT